MSNTKMKDNMKLYEAVRAVPDTAKKPIKGGRLKGMTDITPMWRLKVLTEQFGPCGLGWYYEITNQWLESGADGVQVAFTNINLFVKFGEEWSKPIQGTGGSDFVAKEKGGLYTSDECFKMSLTDAISVACKSLGIAADVYYAKDRSKYDMPNETTSDQPTKATGPKNGKLSISDVKVPFGKHKDKTIVEVYREDPDYIEWLEKEAKSPKLKAACAALLAHVKKDEQPEPEQSNFDEDDPPFMSGYDTPFQ